MNAAEVNAVPKVPLPILIINGAKDEEVPLAGGMSASALVRAAQATQFKPVREVEVATFDSGFWQQRFNGARRMAGVTLDLIPSFVGEAMATPVAAAEAEPQP